MVPFNRPHIYDFLLAFRCNFVFKGEVETATNRTRKVHRVLYGQTDSSGQMSSLNALTTDQTTEAVKRQSLQLGSLAVSGGSAARSAPRIGPAKQSSMVATHDARG